MTTFRVESVQLAAPLKKAFEYIAAPQNLPHWTHAFKKVADGKAIMATPAGEVEVNLKVKSATAEGTIDWFMTFPDGTVASAFSRLIPEDHARCVYSFILLAPPVPLERLEGTLNEQAQILREELKKLATIIGQS